MSHEQRLRDLGLPTNLPTREEERILRRRLKGIEARLREAEAAYFRMLDARERSGERLADAPGEARPRSRVSRSRKRARRR